jgi:multidrug efflux system membrane fusion protein
MTIDNQIDTTTGTVKARAQFANANGALFPNQFVNTRLLVKTLENQIMVPSSAIQHNGDIAFVYLIKPGPGKPSPAETGSGASSGGAGTGKSGGGSRKGANRGGGAAPGGSGQGAAGQGGQKAQYHVEVQNVKTGVTDNGWTAVEGIPSGTEVANSSFDKLQDQADIAISKVGIPDTQTTISGESNAP